MSKIIRGYWDCKYCGTKKIDGLVDICENCGKQKSEDVKYYMGSPNDIVTEKELNAANIKIEECDGEHPEWVCPYCEQLNDYTDTVCIACGGNKEEAIENYNDFPSARAGVGMSSEVKRKLYKTSFDEDISCDNENNVSNETNQKDFSCSKEEDLKPDCTNIKQKNKFSETFINSLVSMIPFIPLVILCFILFFPFKHEVVVSDFSWDRTVTVEEYKTVEESDWYLPTEARLLDKQEELYGYEDVLDHYETKTRQASRTVQDGYDTYTTYEDNGNGTFRAVEHSTPKYTTEYYTETYEEPVYRKEPIYKTKYYYEIDKWVIADDYETSGKNKKPYWSDVYTLNSNERDTLREENYYIHYLEENNTTFKNNVSYDEWMNTEIGDEEVVYRSLIGITY